MSISPNCIKVDTIGIDQIIKAMIFHSGEPFVTSNQIAKHFGMRHGDLLRKIREFKSFEAMIGNGKLRHQMRTIKGKEYPYFELDADAFTFISMSITGKKAEAFKWAFIEAFKTASREALTAKITAEANKANQIWIDTRKQGKIAHREYTDIIKEFCTYAEEQRGSPYNINKKGNSINKPCPYFIHFQRVAYQKADVVMKKGKLPKRDSLSGLELERVCDIESNMASMIMQMINEGHTYKSIFKAIKAGGDL